MEWVISAPPAARLLGGWLARPVPVNHPAPQRLAPRRVADVLVRSYLAGLPTAGDFVSAEAADLELFLRIGPRDIEVAPLALKSLRRYLVNPLVRTVVAVPASHVADVRQAFAGAEIVADEDLLPAELARAIARVVPPGRTGWVRQQFLSLVHVLHNAGRPCLVWDADTVMVRPQNLLSGDQASLAISLEHHHPYFRLIRRLLPDLPLPLWSSMVAHHMVLSPDLLRVLITEIEAGAGGKAWWQAILDHVDSQEPSCMADTELYGQWVRHRWPDRVRLVAFRNVPWSRRGGLPSRLEALAGRRRIDSVSLHWWIDA
jgi:hypothetical protein